MTRDSQPAERLQPRATVILIIEDEFLVRLAVAAYLRDSGYTVIEVSNASEALIVVASQTHIDLVFSDIRIPGWMDGEVLANWLSIRRPEIPVILTSGVIAPPLKYKTNAFRFIPKPYSLAHVENAIRELLDKAPGASS